MRWVLRVLVTGSSGFVGATLLRVLKAQGKEAEGISRTSSARFSADLLDYDSLVKILKDFRPKVIVNCAAQTNLKGVKRNPQMLVNSIGVTNIMKAFKCTNSERRLVQISSQLVHRLDIPPGKEDHFDPVGDYGASKAIAEAAVSSADGAGAEWAVLRCPTIWGPGMSEHYAGILRLVKKGRYVHLKRGPVRKTYAYIDNLAHQIAAVVDAPAARVHRRVLYLGDYQPLDVTAWINAFAAGWGRHVPTVPDTVARAAAALGDFSVRVGLPLPITSDRLNNLTLEYCHDLSPIKELAPALPVFWRDGVELTRAWIDDAAQLSHIDRNVVPALV
ncbi:MAG: NAD-dependent epimerase/dehydratase family protein [Sphingomonas sp.]|nr:NAD-dependent epimerase/dehydratase family protein [Sphingomonas sp.]